MQGEVLETQSTYWRKQLDGAPALLDLPADRPRPAMQSYSGSVETKTLPQGLLKDLKALSRQEGCSLFMTLLAAFQTLLYRYTSHEDIVVGSPIAGRTRTEIEPLIGFFVNTLVLRCDLSGNPSFRDFLKRVRDMTLGAYAHQDLPFEMVVKEVHPERNQSYNPLCQVMFLLQNTPPVPPRFGALSLTMESVSPGASENDFTLMLREESGALTAAVEYCVDLFDQSTIRRFLGNYQTLLEGIVANPNQEIAFLPILTEEEKHRLLVEWNDTAREYPRDKCLHQLFEIQAETTPEAVAVVYGNQRLTYRELNARANQLARHLQNMGTKPDSLVGICIERSLEMVIGLLGILKAGAAYVPLDPEYPPQRLAFMLEDAAVTVLLTQARHIAAMAAMPASAARRIISLDSDWPAIAREIELNVQSPVTSENLAYMIYTSGSTGQPKGAMNTHRGIVNRLLWMQDTYQLTPADSVLQKTPFSFDVSVWEFFWPLLAGARLVMARPGGQGDAAYLARLIATEKITTIHFVPSMLRAFLDLDTLNASCSSLKRVICSGEALPIDLMRRFFSTLGAGLHNLYGPTEASVDVTHWPCQPATPLNTVPIGRPIANTQIYILDASLQPVPVGVPGELHIGGVGLARGYHNRPQLTAQKFIANPFSADPAARLYKTGDLARFLPDGNIEYLGRLDLQVKIRGFRVELAEIEELLNQHPAVQANVVVAREDAPGDKRLIAYIVSPNGAASPAQLREYLRLKLPLHMVPAAFATLQSLPLTPSGKVDRKALPRPDFETIADKDKFEVPGTPTEIVLARIWREVLGLKHVGINDNFFELGGHSMLAVQLISKINRSLLLDLPIPALLKYSTVKELAAIIDHQNRDGFDSLHDNQSHSSMVAFQPSGSRPPLFFLHGDWNGGGIYAGRLSQQLGEDQPFYALPPYRSEQQTALTIEEMAVHHIAAIQEHTPHGPYLIGGYCIGATVAMEIARQLVDQGEEVSHLLLLDPPLTSSPVLPAIWHTVDNIGEFRKWDLSTKIHYFQRFGVPVARSLWRLGVSFRHWLRRSPRGKFIALCHYVGIRTRSSPIPVEREEGGGVIVNSLDYALYVLACHLYKARPLSVPATLYFPQETPPSPSLLEKRARSNFPLATIETVPGDHDTCITKYTSALGDKMKNTLATLSCVLT
jgi:amino acid adenylation domain-containing protein